MHARTHSQLVPSRPEALWRGLLLKACLDQFVLEPPMLLLCFWAFGAMRGTARDATAAKVRDEYAATYVADTALWLPAQLLNFRFVPVQHQALVVNGVSVGWNAYLSLVQHRQRSAAAP
jgi:protein Mpv17